MDRSKSLNSELSPTVRTSHNFKPRPQSASSHRATPNKSNPFMTVKEKPQPPVLNSQRSVIANVTRFNHKKKKCQSTTELEVIKPIEKTDDGYAGFFSFLPIFNFLGGSSEQETECMKQPKNDSGKVGKRKRRPNSVSRHSFKRDSVNPLKKQESAPVVTASASSNFGPCRPNSSKTDYRVGVHKIKTRDQKKAEDYANRKRSVSSPQKELSSARSELTVRFRSEHRNDGNERIPVRGTPQSILKDNVTKSEPRLDASDVSDNTKESSVDLDVDVVERQSVSCMSREQLMNTSSYKRQSKSCTSRDHLAKTNPLKFGNARSVSQYTEVGASNEYKLWCARSAERRKQAEKTHIDRLNKLKLQKIEVHEEGPQESIALKRNPQNSYVGQVNQKACKTPVGNSLGVCSNTAPVTPTVEATHKDIQSHVEHELSVIEKCNILTAGKVSNTFKPIQPDNASDASVEVHSVDTTNTTDLPCCLVNPPTSTTSSITSSGVKYEAKTNTQQGHSLGTVNTTTTTDPAIKPPTSTTLSVNSAWVKYGTKDNQQQGHHLATVDTQMFTDPPCCPVKPPTSTTSSIKSTACACGAEINKQQGNYFDTRGKHTHQSFTSDSGQSQIYIERVNVQRLTKTKAVESENGTQAEMLPKPASSGTTDLSDDNPYYALSKVSDSLSQQESNQPDAGGLNKGVDTMVQCKFAISDGAMAKPAVIVGGCERIFVPGAMELTRVESNSLVTAVTKILHANNNDICDPQLLAFPLVKDKKRNQTIPKNTNMTRKTILQQKEPDLLAHSSWKAKKRNPNINTKANNSCAHTFDKQEGEKRKPPTVANKQSVIKSVPSMAGYARINAASNVVKSSNSVLNAMNMETQENEEDSMLISNALDVMKQASDLAMHAGDMNEGVANKEQVHDDVKSGRVVVYEEEVHQRENKYVGTNKHQGKNLGNRDIGTSVTCDEDGCVQGLVDKTDGMKNILKSDETENESKSTTRQRNILESDETGHESKFTSRHTHNKQHLEKAHYEINLALHDSRKIETASTAKNNANIEKKSSNFGHKCIQKLGKHSFLYKVLSKESDKSKTGCDYICLPNPELKQIKSKDKSTVVYANTQGPETNGGSRKIDENSSLYVLKEYLMFDDQGNPKKELFGFRRGLKNQYKKSKEFLGITCASGTVPKASTENQSSDKQHSFGGSQGTEDVDEKSENANEHEVDKHEYECSSADEENGDADYESSSSDGENDNGHPTEDRVTRVTKKKSWLEDAETAVATQTSTLSSKLGLPDMRTPKANNIPMLNEGPMGDMRTPKATGVNRTPLNLQQEIHTVVTTVKDNRDARFDNIEAQESQNAKDDDIFDVRGSRYHSNPAGTVGLDTNYHTFKRKQMESRRKQDRCENDEVPRTKTSSNSTFGETEQNSYIVYNDNKTPERKSGYTFISEGQTVVQTSGEKGDVTLADTLASVGHSVGGNIGAWIGETGENIGNFVRDKERMQEVGESAGKICGKVMIHLGKSESDTIFGEGVRGEGQSIVDKSKPTQKEKGDVLLELASVGQSVGGKLGTLIGEYSDNKVDMTNKNDDSSKHRKKDLPTMQEICEGAGGFLGDKCGKVITKVGEINPAAVITSKNLEYLVETESDTVLAGGMLDGDNSNDAERIRGAISEVTSASEDLLDAMDGLITVDRAQQAAANIYSTVSETTSVVQEKAIKIVAAVRDHSPAIQKVVGDLVKSVRDSLTEPKPKEGVEALSDTLNSIDNSDNDSYDDDDEEEEEEDGDGEDGSEWDISSDAQSNRDDLKQSGGDKRRSYTRTDHLNRVSEHFLKGVINEPKEDDDKQAKHTRLAKISPPKPKEDETEDSKNKQTYLKTELESLYKKTQSKSSYIVDKIYDCVNVVGTKLTGESKDNSNHDNNTHGNTVLGNTDTYTIDEANDNEDLTSIDGSSFDDAATSQLSSSSSILSGSYLSDNETNSQEPLQNATIITEQRPVKHELRRLSITQKSRAEVFDENDYDDDEDDDCIDDDDEDDESNDKESDDGYIEISTNVSDNKAVTIQNDIRVYREVMPKKSVSNLTLSQRCSNWFSGSRPPVNNDIDTVDPIRSYTETRSKRRSSSASFSMTKSHSTPTRVAVYHASAPVKKDTPPINKEETHEPMAKERQEPRYTSHLAHLAQAYGDFGFTMNYNHDNVASPVDIPNPTAKTLGNPKQKDFFSPSYLTPVSQTYSLEQSVKTCDTSLGSSGSKSGGSVGRSLSGFSKSASESFSDTSLSCSEAVISRSEVDNVKPSASKSLVGNVADLFTYDEHGYPKKEVFGFRRTVTDKIRKAWPTKESAAEGKLVDTPKETEDEFSSLTSAFSDVDDDDEEEEIDSSYLEMGVKHDDDTTPTINMHVQLK